MGGSGSGKSKYAEDVAVGLYKNNGAPKLIYIATMMPFGSESLEKIKRHRKMREGKGFFTVECYSELYNVEIEKGSIVLIECMSNLVANEIFSCNKSREDVILSVEKSIKKFLENLCSVVFVTNDIFSDGVCYNKEVGNYIETLAEINKILCKYSDFSVEIVCGIPVYMKNKG